MIDANQIPDEAVEASARLIAPGAWRVMDAERAAMLRKYKGENVGWPADQFQDKESMVIARASIAAALNAWPGSYSLAENDSAEIRGVAAIILPLPQEVSDE